MVCYVYIVRESTFQCLMLNELTTTGSLHLTFFTDLPTLQKWIEDTRGIILFIIIFHNIYIELMFHDAVGGVLNVNFK